MRVHLIALSVILLSSCTTRAPIVATTPQPPALPTEDVVGTIAASGPMIEVTFDGTECSVAGPTELPVGTLVTKFINSSDVLATPYVARNYPGKTWHDILEWIDTHPSETPGWIAILGYDRSVSETPTVSYRQYLLDLEAEYHIVVESTLKDEFWPCGPFQVVAAP